MDDRTRPCGSTSRKDRGFAKALSLTTEAGLARRDAIGGVGRSAPPPSPTPRTAGLVAVFTPLETENPSLDTSFVTRDAIAVAVRPRRLQSRFGSGHSPQTQYSQHFSATDNRSRAIIFHLNQVEVAGGLVLRALTPADGC